MILLRTRPSELAASAAAPLSAADLALRGFTKIPFEGRSLNIQSTFERHSAST